MPTIDSLHELLKHELKDLYSAETQLIKALPEMVNAATDDALKHALTKHFQVTKDQKKRLEQIQKLLGGEKTEKEKKGFFANLFSSNEGEQHCKAMEGLIKEGNSVLKEDMTQEVMDAAIIAAAQKIEHYEISSYGTARAFALQLQLDEVAGLLEQTLNEEYEADNLLTALAISDVNLTAEGSGMEADEVPAKKATKPKAQKPVKKAAPKKAKAAAKKSSSTKKAAATKK